MNRFVYTASSASGQTLRGSVWAREAADARREVLRRGFTPIRLVMSEGPLPRAPGNHAQRLAAFRALLTHLSAGVSVRRTLSATEGLSLAPDLSAALADVRRLVAEGERLGDALERTGVAQPSIGALIRSGEKSGELVQAFEQAVAHLEFEEAALAHVRRSMTYPAFLFVSAIVSFSIIVLLVLPRFAAIVTEIGADPPMLGSVLLRVSVLIQAHIFSIGLASGLAIVIGTIALLHSRGRIQLIRILLRMPVVASLHRLWTSALSARSLSSMLRAGMSVNRALEVLIQNAPSPALRAKLKAAHSLVSEGQPLSRALVSSGVIPARSAPLLEVGETTAQLGEMLARVSIDLEREASEAVDGAITLIQPSIVLVFGILIAFVAALVLQTLYSIRPV